MGCAQACGRCRGADAVLTVLLALGTAALVLLALVGDERGLIAGANMHLPGRQIDPDRIRRDLRRLSAWERERSPEGVPAT